MTVGVTNVLGRVFVERTQVSPFEAADRAVAELEARGADLVLVDAHAEATSEKLALGHHLDGRAQAVLGTHTHVPTADLSVLPGGTAYVTDVGMTGCKDEHHRLRAGGLPRPVPGGAGGGSRSPRAAPSSSTPRSSSSTSHSGRAVGVEAVRESGSPELGDAGPFTIDWCGGNDDQGGRAWSSRTFES